MTADKITQTFKYIKSEMFRCDFDRKKVFDKPEAHSTQTKQFKRVFMKPYMKQVHIVNRTRAARLSFQSNGIGAQNTYAHTYPMAASTELQLQKESHQNNSVATNN